MYISEANEKVKKIYEKIDNLNDIKKLEILLSVFNLINNNQINNKNEVNPDLIEDDDIKVFNMELLGFEPNYCTIFLQYNLMLYNAIFGEKKLYEDNGNVLGFNYDNEEKEILSSFEKLSFNDKLDIIAEFIIRYDNGTYIQNNTLPISLHSKLNGFEIANMIKKIKI